MSIIIIPTLVIPSIAGIEDANLDNPVIGINNQVTASNITGVTSQDPNFPASNMGNPSTALVWKSLIIAGSGQVVCQIPLSNPTTVNYLGVAKHNFGSDQSLIYIQQFVSGAWISIFAGVVVPNDGPVIFRWDGCNPAATDIRLIVINNTLLSTAAVVYIGSLTMLPRRIYVGHTPITMGRATNVVNGMSESGNFLGRLILGEARGTSFSQKNVNASNMRTIIDPFVKLAQSIPFFFAWRPLSYPFEVGYCWLNGDVKPSNQLANGMMQCDFNVTGIV